MSNRKPEYIEKTITIGAANIVILRPILSETEASKVKEKARVNLENIMRDHYITRSRAIAQEA